MFLYTPQRPTFNITKASLFYQYMRHLLKNQSLHIMVNDSHYPIPQLEENKKLYTARDINRVDCARKLQNITVQPIKQTLHSVDNKILHNLPIFREDVGIDEDIYGTSVPYLQGKQSVTRLSMWNTSWYQIPPSSSLINTINSPYAVTLCTSTALAS